MATTDAAYGRIGVTCTTWQTWATERTKRGPLISLFSASLQCVRRESVGAGVVRFSNAEPTLVYNSCVQYPLQRRKRFLKGIVTKEFPWGNQIIFLFCAARHWSTLKTKKKVFSGGRRSQSGDLDRKYSFMWFFVQPFTGVWVLVWDFGGLKPKVFWVTF